MRKGRLSRRPFLVGRVLTGAPVDVSRRRVPEGVGLLARPDLTVVCGLRHQSSQSAPVHASLGLAGQMISRLSSCLR